MSDAARLHIDSIAAGGAGVGRLDGMAVFVPRTAPGDDVEVSLRRHRRYAEGRVRRVLVASPARVRPVCPHYERDRCGGCQLQHLAYEAQLEAKRDVVEQALRRIAHRDTRVDAVVPSPSPWRYRNKLTLTLRRSAAGWRGGLRPWDDPDEVFALDDCPITSERVVAAWREVLAAAADLPSVPELRGAVREVGAAAGLTLSGGRSWPRAQAFVRRCPSLLVVRWDDEAGGRHLLRDDAGEDVAIGSFEQVNPATADALHAHVASVVERYDPESIVDAYGGRGATAERLRREGRRIVLIEVDPDATRLATRTLGPAAQVVTGRVEDELARTLPARAVILNPPRAGVDAAVCAALEAASPAPAVIVYVSCDPATLARDLGRLPSWRIASLVPFDMFPQTAHVEAVCELVPRAA